MWLLLAGAVVLLAYENGANDNFKGVATIHGSGAASYWTALAWATVTTLAGSMLALALAGDLVRTFSARGLVPEAVAASPAFLAATALGAAATVLAATRLGLPVSTTHALTGALVGAGLVAGDGAVNLGVLGRGFFLPLLVSPVLAVALMIVVYPLAHRARLALGVRRERCVCLGTEWVSVAAVPAGGAAALAGVQHLALTATTGTVEGCQERYQGRLLGVSAQRLLDAGHFLSAGAVSLARGLNDTPKIFALLVAARAVAPRAGLLLVGGAMALGGLRGARRVAETLSHRIARIEAGPGLTSNLLTAALVLGASRLGLPVSTTHVSTGGLFGIALLGRTAHWRTISSILLAWLSTLPLGCLLGALSALLLLP